MHGIKIPNYKKLRRSTIVRQLRHFASAEQQTIGKSITLRATEYAAYRQPEQLRATQSRLQDNPRSQSPHSAATISSLINEVGYAILIPLAALIYFMNGRNPLLGIITAFCGVAFGYGVTIFVGSMEISLMDYTKTASWLIDEGMHISLTSNLFFIIAT